MNEESVIIVPEEKKIVEFNTDLTVETAEPRAEISPMENPLASADTSAIELLMKAGMEIANTSMQSELLWVMGACTVHACWRELESRKRVAENNKYAFEDKAVKKFIKRYSNAPESGESKE